MKNLLLIILILTFNNFQTVKAQTNLISAADGGFESGTSFSINGWSVINSSPVQTNQWFCAGTGPSGFIGTRCAFVGTAATNNNYNNVASVSHLFRTITFPPGETEITLTFRWKCRGRSNEDYMALYFTPSTFTPSAGVIINSGQIGTEYRNQTTWGVETVTLPCSFAGTTQRLVFSWVNDGAQNNNPAIALDNISITTSSLGTCESLLGLGVYPVSSLPYNSGPGTTCNMNDDVKTNNSSVCGNPLYYGDKDVVWVFTPQTSGQVAIDLNAPVAVSTGLMLYDGCPITTCDLASSNCVAQAQDISGNKSLCVPVIANHTYYLVLDGNAVCNNYDNLYISSPNNNVVGNTCSNPYIINSFPFNLPNESTACMGDDYNNTTVGSCGSLFESGEDKVYMYEALGPECLSIVLSNMSTSLMGYTIFEGCPGAGGVCIGGYGGGIPLVTNFTLPSAGIYYIIVDSWAPPMSVSYDISITSYGNTLVSNDEPCMAQEVSIGQITFGDNNCSTDSNEPSIPSCWVDGEVGNTVWFKCVIPPSGNLFVSTQLITLQNTQIAAFLGSCGSLVEIDCNDDAGFLNPSSSLNLSGLPPGDTLFISVDGYSFLVGTFNILFIEGSIGSAYNQQDCLGAINVCSSVMSSNDSYFGPGLIDEIPAPGSISNPDINPAGYNSGCLLSGERNTVWYSINITSPGVLSWKLTHQPGCYDWIMYDLTNNSCSDILNNTLAPVRCNWNGACLTTAGMMNVIPAGSSPFDFQAPLDVVAGQSFVLALSNWSGTSGNYSIDFSSSTCGFGGSNMLNWSGENGNEWESNVNWGGCTVPGCGISSSIFPSSNQPVISSNAIVQDLTILPGATLTLGPYSVLQVCGNFTNLGNLNADPTSVIVLTGDSTSQYLDGLLIGNNRVGGVYIPKLAGSVILNNDIELQGELTLVDPNCVFDLNGQKLITSSSIYNSNGSSSFLSSVAGSTLEFNGETEQYFATNGDVTLSNLSLNKISGITEFLDGNIILDSLGTLYLTNGTLFTGNYELIIRNKNPQSIIGGSDSSYIIGNLRRSLSGNPDTYEFPLGGFNQGFQRAQIEFTTPTSIPELFSNFNSYISIPNGPSGIDCNSYEYNVNQVLDQGYWNIHASANSDSGLYNVTLYNQNFSPVSSYTTVVKSSIDPPTELTWELVGDCDPFSNQQVTRRTGLRGFSSFGVGVAGESTLPISLIEFAGVPVGSQNHLFWNTASEVNSDLFELEYSDDGLNFNLLSTHQAAGNATTTKNYTSFDTRPESVRYYRLKSIDFNGAYKYSDIIVIMRKELKNVFSISPNPAHHKCIFTFGFDTNTDMRLDVFNTSGELVTEVYKGVSGKEIHQITSDFSSLKNGVYYCRLISSSGSQTIKLVLL